MSVYLSGNNGLQVVVKGWLPKRIKELFDNPNAPHYFDCDTFDDACHLYFDLIKELLHYVQSSE